MEIEFRDPRDRGLERLASDFAEIERSGAVRETAKYFSNVLEGDRPLVELSLDSGDTATVNAGFNDAGLATLLPREMHLGKYRSPGRGDSYYVGRGDDFAHRYIKIDDNEATVRETPSTEENAWHPGVRDQTVSGIQVGIYPEGDGSYELLGTGQNESRLVTFGEGEEETYTF